MRPFECLSVLHTHTHTHTHTHQNESACVQGQEVPKQDDRPLLSCEVLSKVYLQFEAKFGGQGIV